MIDVSAVLERVRALGAIGRTADGGVSRLAYSPEDREARALLVRWMDELGLRVREDAAGNIFGRRGSADRPALLIGSHIDSVPNGGIWDGCLGVCTALETAAALPPLPMPLEVVSWQMEESSRFGQATFGSRVFSGRIDPLAAAAWRDRDGLGLGDLGVDTDRLLECAAPAGSVLAYLELHIEQGIILRQAGVPVGAVTGIAAPLRAWVTVIGEAAHSGAALPEQRKDALMAAGQVLAHVEELVRRERAWGTVATIGSFRVKPNAMNVVPGEVEMSLDVRGVYADSRRRLARAILQTAARVAAARGLELRLSVVGEEEPVLLPEPVVASVERAAAGEGLDCTRIVSLAGHDAMQVAHVAPAGMILIRNVSGTSHSPSESVADEDVAAGARVFYQTVLELGTDPHRTVAG